MNFFSQLMSSFWGQVGVALAIMALGSYMAHLDRK